jgi:hypothetical protein
MTHVGNHGSYFQVIWVIDAFSDSHLEVGLPLEKAYMHKNKKPFQVDLCLA